MRESLEGWDTACYYAISSNRTITMLQSLTISSPLHSFSSMLNSP